MYIFFFFFFQAEDGIRDKLVTGVQTCALPIFRIPFVLFSSRPCWLLHFSLRGGGGMRGVHWRCFASAAARKFHRIFSACAPMIYWRRSFRSSRHARRTLRRATSTFPIIR